LESTKKIEKSFGQIFSICDDGAEASSRLRATPSGSHHGDRNRFVGPWLGIKATLGK
jgi:hypothetical protein